MADIILTGGRMSFKTLLTTEVTDLLTFDSTWTMSAKELKSLIYKRLKENYPQIKGGLFWQLQKAILQAIKSEVRNKK